MRLGYRKQAALGVLIAFVVGAIWGAIVPTGFFQTGGNIDAGANIDIGDGTTKEFQNITTPWLIRIELFPPFTIERLDIIVFATNCSGVLEVNATADGQVVSSILAGPGTFNSTASVSWTRFPPSQPAIDVSVRAINGTAHADLYQLSFSDQIIDYNPLNQAVSLAAFVGFGLLIISWVDRLRKR